MDIGDSSLLLVLASIIFLSMLIRAAIMFDKRSSKYNFSFLLIAIIPFVGTTLEYFHPGKLKYLGSSAVQVTLVAILVIVFIAFLFHPDIKHFLTRWEMESE